jgi:hypothetical protein
VGNRTDDDDDDNAMLILIPPVFRVGLYLVGHAVIGPRYKDEMAEGYINSSFLCFGGFFSSQCCTLL